MDNILFSIDPIVKTTTTTIIKIDMSIIEVSLFQSCTVRVGLYSDTGILVMNKLIKIDGDDYKNWSNDDNYIIEFIKNKISSEFI